MIKKRKIEALPEYSFTGHESIFGKLEKAKNPREETIVIIPNHSEKGIREEILEPEKKGRNAYDKNDSEVIRRSIMSSSLNLSKKQASLHATDSFMNKRERFYEKLRQVSETPRKEIYSTFAPGSTTGRGDQGEANSPAKYKIEVTSEKVKTENRGIMGKTSDIEKKTESTGSMFPKSDSKLFGNSEANTSSPGLFGNTEKKPEQNILNLGYKITGETGAVDLSKTQRFERPTETSNKPAPEAPKQPLFGSTPSNPTEKPAANLFASSIPSSSLITTSAASTILGGKPPSSTPGPTSATLFGPPASSQQKIENKPGDAPSLFGNTSSSSAAPSLFAASNNPPQTGSLFGNTSSIPEIKENTGNKSLFSTPSLLTASSTNTQPFGKNPADSSASTSMFSGSGAGIFGQTLLSTTPAGFSTSNSENKLGSGDPKANTGLFGGAKTNPTVFGDTKANASLFGESKGLQPGENKPNQPLFGDNKGNSSLFGENRGTTSLLGENSSQGLFGGSAATPSVFQGFDSNKAGEGKQGLGLPATNINAAPVLFGGLTTGANPSGNLFGSTDGKPSGSAGFLSFTNTATGGFGGKPNDTTEGQNKSNPTNASLFGSTGSNLFSGAPFSASNPSNQGLFKKSN